MMKLELLWEYKITAEYSWVAAVVKDIQWRLILVLENEEKIWKRSWQLSIPMETRNEKEPFINCMYRWLEEELGICKFDIFEFRFFIGEDSVLLVKNFNWWWVKVNLKIFEVVVNNFNPDFSNEEIWNVIFKSYEQIIYELTKQNWNLRDFINNRWRPFALEAILKVCSGIPLPSVVKIENWIYTDESFENLKRIINQAIHGKTVY
jgi:hypothetical protein